MTDNKFAAPFIEMAERIGKNDPKEFGGAMLIVPPQGDPIAVMVTDPSQPTFDFLALCQSKLAMRVDEATPGKTPAGTWPGYKQR